MSSKFARADAYIIDRLCAPLCRRAGQAGHSHMALAQESLRVGLVTIVLSNLLDVYYAEAVWTPAILSLFWVVCYRVETSSLRKQGTGGQQAALMRVTRLRLRTFIMRLLLLFVGVFFVGLFTFGFNASATLANVGLALFWSGEWFRATGTPPPVQQDQRQAKLAEQGA